MRPPLVIVLVALVAALMMLASPALAARAKPIRDPLDVESPVKAPLDGDYDEVHRKERAEKTAKELISEAPAANDDQQDHEEDDHEEVTGDDEDEDSHEAALSTGGEEEERNGEGDEEEEEDHQEGAEDDNEPESEHEGRSDAHEDEHEDEADADREQRLSARTVAEAGASDVALAVESSSRRMVNLPLFLKHLQALHPDIFRQLEPHVPNLVRLAAGGHQVAEIAIVDALNPAPTKYPMNMWRRTVLAAQKVYNLKDVSLAGRIASALLRIRTANNRISAARPAAAVEEEQATLVRQAKQLARSLGLKPEHGDAYPFFVRMNRDLLIKQQQGKKAIDNLKRQIATLRRGGQRAQADAMEKRVQAFQSRYRVLETVTHFFGCLMNPKRDECRAAKLPHWVRESIKERITAARQKIKFDERETEKFRKKLADLKRKEAAVAKKVKKDRRAVKVARRRGAKNIKKVKQVAAKKVREVAKKVKTTVTRSSLRRKKARKLRKGFREISEFKLPKGETSNELWDMWDRATLKPRTPEFAPGMGENYNKLVGHYIWLLSIAL